MTQNSEAAAHVLECISSPDNYNASSNIVFDFLAKKSKTYTDDFIQVLTEVFNDPDVPPRNRFYALYLLAKATETGNELLMTRLTKQRELLNKLFKDCQFNDAKSATEKGKTFFSQAPTPEESILGGNYVRLLLECFSYWNKTFGTDDTSSPLHNYQFMYNTLAERVRMPENFLYVTKTFEVNEDFHYAPPASLSNLHMMRSSSGSPSKIFSPNASLGNLGTIRANSSMPSSPALVESIREQVKSCLSSGRNYKRNNYKVFDGISGANAKKYIAEYLEVTKEIMGAKESTPSQKFYAVYLLLRASETNNKALITELVTTRKDLLSDLYASASFDYKNESRERGRNIFSKEPSEDEGRVGKNFIILTTETLVFWRRSFFVGAKDPTSVFDLINSKLEAKKLIPKEFYYVGKTLDTDGENYATRFEALAPQNFPKSDLKSPGTSPPRATKEFFSSPEEKPRSSSQSPNLQEKVSPSKPPKEENFAAVESIKNPIKVKTSSEKQSPELVQVQEGLNQLEHKKTALRQFLEANKQENDMKDFVDYLSQDVSTTYDQNILPQVDPLISNGSPSSEKYVTRIFTEGEVVENLKGYTSKYKKGQIQYKDFRSKVVPLLRSREEQPAPTTTEPVVTAVVTETSEVIKIQETYQREPREKTKKSAAPPETSLNKPVPQLENLEPIRTDAGLGKPPRSLLSPTAEQANSIITSKSHQKQKSADIIEPTDPNKSTKLTKPIQHLISPVRREEGDTFDGSLKNSSTWKLYSLRTTPGRNGVLEGEDTRQSLKLSRVRSTDLSIIENSIRHSFVSSGRKPPQFKPLDELQAKEEFEKEINKLRLEKDAQQREITRLNSELKQVGNQTQNLKEIDQLRQTVSQQKQKIDSLENEVKALTQQNIELSKLQGRIRELELSQKPGHEADLQESKKITNLTLNQSGGHHQRGRSIDSQSRKLGTGPIEEDEDEEKYETPTNEYSVSQTRYDANWANTQPGASVESSMYDVEWPATAQQGSTNLTAQLEAKQNQNTIIRGQEIEGTHQMYSDIRDRIQGSHELKTFKLANLKTKCPLYENDQIRVGISTAIVHDVSSHKNMLKMVLYYENKSNQFISSFVAEVIQGKNTNRFAKPNPLECSLEQGKQIKQQVVVTFEKVPFEALRLLLSVDGNPYEIYLPTLISKFAEFKLIETDAFLEKWKTQSQNVLKTEEIVIDTSIVKTAYDFKKFFPYLADLNPMNEYEYLQGTKSIKLGGIFEIDGPHQEYLLKINILPTQKVVFQIAVSESESNLASFFLQSLAFLFKKP